MKRGCSKWRKQAGIARVTRRQYYTSFLTEALGNLSLPCAPRAPLGAAQRGFCHALTGLASVSLQDVEAALSLRSRRDPTSPSSVAFDLSAEFLLCPARALLQTSEQLVFLAFGVSKIIVGQLRVFLLQLSLHLVPSAPLRFHQLSSLRDCRIFNTTDAAHYSSGEHTVFGLAATQIKSAPTWRDSLV